VGYVKLKLTLDFCKTILIGAYMAELISEAVYQIFRGRIKTLNDLRASAEMDIFREVE